MLAMLPWSLPAALMLGGGLMPVGAINPALIPAGLETQVVAPAGPGNSRNTEGSIIELSDGRLLLAYTRFYGGGEDESAADIVGRYSGNLGRTWGEAFVLQANDAQQNVMSVSLLRLPTGELLLGYLRKNSLVDCTFVVRQQQGLATAFGPETLVTAPTSYFVVNNDRLLRLSTGRLVVPAADHRGAPQNWAGIGVCFVSDDNGATWRRGEELRCDGAAGLQEPGVVELRDGRLLMIIRCSLGAVYKSYSTDGGLTWSPPVTTGLAAPVAPATIKRIPSTGDLLLIWNHSPDRRVPLSAAISRDDGETWEHIRDLEPEGRSFAYTSICFVDEVVILSYWSEDAAGLSLKVARAPVRWFYGETA